jgi:hypothetical protein
VAAFATPIPRSALIEPDRSITDLSTLSSEHDLLVGALAPLAPTAVGPSNSVEFGLSHL